MCYVNKKPTFQRETQLFPTVFLDILSKIQITLTGTSYLNLKKVNNLTVCIILEITFILIIFEQIYKLTQCLKNNTSTACFHRKYYFTFFISHDHFLVTYIYMKFWQKRQIRNAK